MTTIGEAFREAYAAPQCQRCGEVYLGAEAVPEPCPTCEAAALLIGELQCPICKAAFVAPGPHTCEAPIVVSGQTFKVRIVGPK